MSAAGYAWDVTVEQDDDGRWTAALYQVTDSGDCSDVLDAATTDNPRDSLIVIAHTITHRERANQ